MLPSEMRKEKEPRMMAPIEPLAPLVPGNAVTATAAAAKAAELVRPFANPWASTAKSSMNESSDLGCSCMYVCICMHAYTCGWMHASDAMG